MPEELNEESKTRYEEILSQADASVIEPTDTGEAVRPGVRDVMLEREMVIDVRSRLPDGHSMDQTLGLGLDGAPIGTARNHFGIGDDDLLAGRSINSPLEMTRDSLIDTAADTNNRLPPDLSTGSANPTRNMGLVSGEDGGTEDKSFVDKTSDRFNDWYSGGSSKPSEAADTGTVRPEGDTPRPQAEAAGAAEARERGRLHHESRRRHRRYCHRRRRRTCDRHSRRRYRLRGGLRGRASDHRRRRSRRAFVRRRVLTASSKACTLMMPRAPSCPQASSTRILNRRDRSDRSD